VIFIFVLLHERDRGVLIVHPYVQRGAARADRKRAIPQLSGKVEGLSDWLRLRQAQGVLGHLRLDARAHLARRAEEPIGRREAFQALMRTLEVVVLDEERHPALTVLEVGEHGARQQLLPQRLPEPLDLAAGLRVMRTALHMSDPMTLQLRFELGAATPGGVLAALVGQDLPRRPVLCDAARERLEHQHASLVMRHRKTHQIAGVIIEERGHINPFVPPQQERKEVRLPQLVRLSALEVLYLDLPSYPSLGCLRLDAFGPQHSPHRRLGDAQPQESSHHIADPTATRVGCLLLRRKDRLRALIGRLLQLRMQRRLLRFERLFSALPVRLHPHHDRRIRHA
jgi:hypothetical protein